VKSINNNKKIKILYQKLGEFIAKFERLIFSIKYVKLILLSGNTDQAEILVKNYTAKETIDALATMIDLAIKKNLIEKDDIQLYKALTKDLYELNEKRNKIIHSLWTIAISGDKKGEISAWKPKRNKIFEWEKIDVNLLNEVIKKTEMLSKIVHAGGSLDRLVLGKDNVNYKLADTWKRENDKWILIKRK
jgi:hypothetical protein